MIRDRFWDKRLVNLGEDGAGGGKLLSQGLAHANSLAALPRKNECDAHVLFLIQMSHPSKHARPDLSTLACPVWLPTPR
jgi:hypothetical protein